MRDSISTSRASSQIDMVPSISSGPSTGRAAFTLEIPPEELVMEEEIGRGTYGVVYKATWRGSNVAVKKLLKNIEQKELESFRSEALTMQK